LDPRDEGAPREGRTRGAVGAIVPIVTTSRHKTPSEYKNIDFKRSCGQFGPINMKFGLEPRSLDTEFKVFGLKTAATPGLTPI
jgi:hypothetical protein